LDTFGSDSIYVQREIKVVQSYNHGTVLE